MRKRVLFGLMVLTAGVGQVLFGTEMMAGVWRGPSDGSRAGAASSMVAIAHRFWQSAGRSALSLSLSQSQSAEDEEAAFFNNTAIVTMAAADPHARMVVA